MSEPEQDFAAMFEASVKARRFDRGQTVEGTIVGFGPKEAFVDVGGKAEAVVDLAELKDADGDVEVSVGDRIQAIVVSTSGGIVLSRRGVRNAATQRELEDAFRAGLAVEGKVEKAVKGGYEVRIARERAFCPFSQIDIVRTADPSVHERQVYTFRVIEYKDGGRNVVVSRRKHLEEQQRASAGEVRKTIVPGAVLNGRVVSVPDFGAFVDLGGGIQGLLHVSEMGWSRVTSPGEIVAAGDQITVKVLRVDEATGKIALGLKQLLDDPWTMAATAYQVGQVRPGPRHAGGGVRRLRGARARHRGPGARLHVRADRPPRRVGEVGGRSARRDRSRSSASTPRRNASASRSWTTRPHEPRAPRPPEGALVPGAIVTGKVERHEKFGVFVFLSPGRTGLMPSAETGLDRDADMLKAFPIGSEVEVVVLEVDPAGRRIRLSKKAVAEQQERAELRDYAARSDSGSTVALGSLADNLRNALRGR